MWKALLCLLLATVTLSTAGRTRHHNRAPSFFNFRPEFVTEDDEFVPMEANFPPFGIKAAIDTAVREAEAAEDDDNETTTNKTPTPIAASIKLPREVDNEDGGDSGEENDKPEHRAVPISIKDHTYIKKEKDSLDASYAFGFDLDDQARHETSDPDGNVNGYYSYIDDSGILRKITYTAGAGKGFVILKKEKGGGRLTGVPTKRPKPSPRPPKQNGVQSGEGSDSENSNAESSNNSSGDEEQGFVYPGKPWGALANANNGKGKKKKPIFVVKIRRPVKKNPQPPARRPQPPTLGDDDDEDDWQVPAASSAITDGSYSFAYDTGSSNRKEIADPWGNVRGSYSYIDPAGVRRTVNYIAGGSTGFKVVSAAPTHVKSVYEQAPGYVSRAYGHASSDGGGRRRRLHPLLQPRGAIEDPQPSAIVYHIHPDGTNPWKPWEAKRPRRMHSRKRHHHPNKQNLQQQPENNPESTPELTNTVPIDQQTKATEHLPRGTPVLVQTHPEIHNSHHNLQQQQQETHQEKEEVTTVPVPVAIIANQHQHQRSHGQRSYTGDDDDHLHSGEYQNDATLLNPSYAFAEERFATAGDTRHPVPAQLGEIHGLNAHIRDYQGTAFKNPQGKNKAVGGVEKNNDDNKNEETTTMMNDIIRNVGTAEIVTLTTMSSTQVEKPKGTRRVTLAVPQNENDVPVEVTTYHPPTTTAATITSTSTAPSSRRKSENSRHKNSKTPSQTAMRMTREQTTRTSLNDPEDDQNDEEPQAMSNSGRLVKRLAVA